METTSPRIDLELHRPQALALRSPAKENLYGGAAGGGKSHLMRAAAITYCCAVPGLQAYLFRRFFDDLIKNHMEGPASFHVLLAPLVASGHVTIVQKEIRFWNGSRIFLNHLNHDKDVTRFQGQEIHLLLMDELTHFTEYMYRYLRGRLRLGGLKIPPAYKDHFPRVIASANPGGIGHVWVKRSFVKAGPWKVRRAGKTDGGMTRVFIPARLADNPTLLTNDPDYVQRLEGLGEPVLVRAMLEGDWDIVAGAPFGDVWRRTRHVCKPFSIPADWKIWRGGDDGYAAPAAIYWLAEHPTHKTIYVIREVYGPKMLPNFLASKILATDTSITLTDGDTRWKNSETFSGYLDSAAFADTGQGEKTVPRGHALNELGCKFKPAPKWPGSRVDRVRLMHKMLAENPLDPERKPGIIFFENCTNAIDTIPTLPRDPHDVEDVDTDAEDHAFDAVTYGLQWRRGSADGRRRIGGV